MTTRSARHVSLVVEGDTDAALVERLCEDRGWTVTAVHGREGRAFIEAKVSAYNNAARRSCWIVLMDLDRDACAKRLRQTLLPYPSKGMCFRIAVRAMEAWLLADAEALAAQLQVSRKRIPVDPESLSDPKQVLVQLASASSSARIRSELVPRANSGRRVGAGYSQWIIEFVRDHWRSEVARANAPSLDRFLRDLASRE